MSIIPNQPVCTTRFRLSEYRGMVTALNMNLQGIKETCNPGAPSTFQALNKPLDMIQEIAGEIRNISRNLMPETLIGLGLSDALRQYCAFIEENSNIRFELHIYGDCSDIDTSISISLYRIFQELIQNMVKHSEATEAAIQIRRDQDKIMIHVEDNGKGFDVATKNEKGFGLENIESRLKVMKGYFSINSFDNRGTTILIEIDLDTLKQ
jgi:two-component system NarL family sensor kinase